jgi:hypothetical protein
MKHSEVTLSMKNYLFKQIIPFSYLTIKFSRGINERYSNL